jgi:hypothetical protein
VKEHHGTRWGVALSTRDDANTARPVSQERFRCLDIRGRH